MRKILFAPFALAILLIAGCSADGLSPQQEAVALNDTYQAIAAPALACVQAEECNEKAGDAIRAADKVAFAYVEEVSQAAIAYDEAPEDLKPAKLTVFDRVLILGKGAVDQLAGLLVKL